MDCLCPPRRALSLSKQMLVSFVPERKQDTVADQYAQPPQDCQPQADVLEVVVAAGQQVPRLQLLGAEPLGHLIVHDALHSAAGKVEDVGHLELGGGVQVSVAAAPSDFLDLLFQRGVLFGNDGCSSPEGREHSGNAVGNMFSARYGEEQSNIPLE